MTRILKKHPKTWIAAALLFAVFLVGGVDLARFISRYNEANPPRLFYVYPIFQTEFSYADRTVRFTEDPDAPGGPRVNVHYGDASLSIPVSIPARFDLPDLHKHEDWLRVILWQESEAFNAEAVKEAKRSGTMPGNLVLVVRELPAGHDPETDGQLARYDWTFSFHEFLAEPDAQGNFFRSSRQAYPESRRQYNKRKKAAAAEGLPPPPRRPNELQENTWQYHAAMSVMPEGAAPSHSFNRNALVAAGWRWSIPALALTGCVIAIALALAPDRPKDEESA